MPYKGTVQEQMSRIIRQYTKSVVQESDDAFRSVAKESAQKLRNTSPKKKGDYAKGWAVKTIKKGKLTGVFASTGEYVVYNRTDWHLTHLLEKGHDVVNAKGRVGYAPPHIHIAPVERWVLEELPRVIKRKLE